VKIPLVDLRAQYNSIKGEIDEAVGRVLEGGQFILGPEVKALEGEIAAYCGVKYAVGVASGTDALHLALLASGLKPGDEVITTPFTFAATTEAIAHCGAKPVFTDIDPVTFNLDPAGMGRCITGKTRAILPVHLYGQSADMGPRRWGRNTGAGKSAPWGMPAVSASFLPRCSVLTGTAAW
jgi:dTDP-4-amino-4,6-dideoxygalactose transaminase